jgi:hypothetical protein
MAGRHLSVRDEVCGTRKGGAALFVNHQTLSHLSLLECDGISPTRGTGISTVCGWSMECRGVDPCSQIDKGLTLLMRDQSISLALQKRRGRA